MSNYGIDYGMGLANIDDHGIRYAVIGQHELHPEALADFEGDYGEPHCPKCGSAVVEYDEEVHGEFLSPSGCADYACVDCEHAWDSSETLPDEALGWTYEDKDYTLQLDDHGDVWVLRSPYYTHAQFCSPCAPGACHLEHPADVNGPRCYALGADWFEGGKAPYPVFAVPAP